MRFHLSRYAQSLQRKPRALEVHGPILPVELIEHIFVLACGEDGAAARALSVVCRAAHSVAKHAARFDTVALRSGTEREVRRCLSLLSAARTASATRREWVARPIVRHLCVLISPTDAWRLTYADRRNHSNPDYDPTPVVEATFDIRDGLSDAFQTLLLQVAPDLETLCVLRIPGDREDRLLLPSDIDTVRYGRGFGGFPNLRDLLFVGSLHFEPAEGNSGVDDSEAGDPNSKIPNAPLFPALRRLHIAPSWGTNTIPFDRWTKDAPGLENLRITLSLPKKAEEMSRSALPPELVRFGSAMSQVFSKFGGTPRPMGRITSRFHSLQEVAVVITRPLVPPGQGDRKGLARRMAKRLTTPKPKPDPRLTSLWRHSFSPRDDCFDATEEYLDHDWRKRVADPADGINLYEFSQASKRNVTVYRTTLAGTIH